MGEDMGEGGDPFERLLDPSFVDQPGPRERSADERAREVEARVRARREREAALAARLAAEADQTRRDDRSARRRDRRGSLRRYGVALAAMGVVVAGAWVYTDQRMGTTEGGDQGSAPDSAIVEFTPPRPDDYPPVDESASSEPLGSPPVPTGAGGPFEFMAMQPDGTSPVAWDPCRPVRYVVNPVGAPPGSGELLADAVGRTSAATGLQFESVGTTDETWSKQRDIYQPNRYGEKWAPVLVAWGTEAEVPGLAGYIAGMAGPSMASDADGTLVSVSGSVVLDSEAIGELIALGRGEDARAIIQHELGHLVGLDHVADPTQLMYSETGAQPVLDWGSGDLVGLYELGTQPCRPDM